MYKSFLLTLILATQVFYAHSQCKQNVPSKAMKQYEEAGSLAQKTQFNEAEEALLKAIKTFPDYVDANILLGQLTERKDLDAAIGYYEKAIEVMPDCTPMTYVFLAEAQRRNEMYDDALENYKSYFDFAKPSLKWDRIARKGVKDCEFARVAIKTPVPFNPQNLGPAVNSKFNEYHPSLTVDENNLIFTRMLMTEGEAGNENEDMYLCKRQSEEEWGQAWNIGEPVNTQFNEGAQTMSPDGKFIFFTRCNAPDGLGSCDIYMVKFEGGYWSKPVNLGRTINSPYAETQPCLSADGKTLYFASNRKGSIGGYDIYKSTFDGNQWDYPINLGKTINTDYDEECPFIHPDGQTLYYSSEGHAGFGDHDFFMTQRTGDTTWTTPKNLGYPINSSKMELSIFINGKGNTAYISSEKDGGLGGMDIYGFELSADNQPSKVSYVKGKVSEAGSGVALSSSIDLINLNTKEVVSHTISDSKTGEFLVPLPIGNSYAYLVNKSGYLTASENFELSNINDVGTPYILNIELKKLGVGETVIMKNIFFESNSYQLKDQSIVELDNLFSFLNKNPNLKIEIGGHTDNIGKEIDNQTLSENRAKSVVNYLEEKGIESFRLSAKGYGKTKPIADNNTEEGRAQNRRTEFKVLGN